MPTQEREQALARQLKAPPVNQRAEGHVFYDPAVGSVATLALMATAGASHALVGQEWNLLGGNDPGAPVTPAVAIEGTSGNGWWGERYYILPESLEPASDVGLGAVLGFDSGDVRYGTRLVEHLPPIAIAPVNVDPVAVYRRARQSAVKAETDALEHVQRRLDNAKSAHTHTPPRDVIRFLAEDVGVGQLVTARALGVTPTAVRKWRRGESAKPEHRGKLASFAGMCSLLMELGLHDPAGWLDIAISDQSTLTPLDLFIGGRPDLSVMLGSRLADPQATLDAFDSAWRTRYPVDADYEVVTLGDGSRSAVPRRRGEIA